MSFQVSPKACQGSNRYSCTYTLIDMTKPNPHNPVGLNVFADNIEDFPKCIRAGDIIRCTKVMVEIRNGYSKLIGNPRNKSSYITFSRKVNFLTGFSESIDESCRTEGLRLDCPWGLFSLEWVVHSSDKNKRRENETVTMQKVKQLHSWAEGLFMGCTLGEKNKTDKSLHEVYQNTTFTVENEGFSRAPKIDRCDVICMVAATASEITGASIAHDKRKMIYCYNVRACRYHNPDKLIFLCEISALFTSIKSHFIT